MTPPHLCPQRRLQLKFCIAGLYVVSASGNNLVAFGNDVVNPNAARDETTGGPAKENRAAGVGAAEFACLLACRSPLVRPTGRSPIFSISETLFSEIIISELFNFFFRVFGVFTN